jgi:uncharacterized protein (TIGR00375 family)
MNQIIADLHLHSKYSRAVSQQMDLPHMAIWAQKKGINLLGTGDFTHPLWLKQIESQLTEAADGTYKLKTADNPTSFVLTGEISSIYSQGGRLRRIHNVVINPNIETARKVNAELAKRNVNLMSDGRPIIGLSSIQLSELVFSVSDKNLIIPAHVWTPWFSLYGSKSGFDSLEECFGEYSGLIYGIETGLSSDPAMNWRIKDIGTRSILSFSDAHSPAKLGREATVFQSKTKNPNDFSFPDLARAIKKDKDAAWRIAYTIEFYPEEGKYHYTGHRNCNISQSPQETKKTGKTCPVCGRPLTVGVMHRVEELAGNQDIKITKKESKEGVMGIYPPHDITQPPYVMLVPLLEIIAQSLNSTTGAIKVSEQYEQLIKNLGSEFTILLKTPLEKIARAGNPKIAEGVDKVRKGKISIKPGFDGVFGAVSIWGEGEKTEFAKQQMSLF